MKNTWGISHIILLSVLSLQVTESYKLIVAVDNSLIGNLDPNDWANFKTVISNLDVELLQISCTTSQFNLISKVCQMAQTPGISGVISSTCEQIGHILDDISTNIDTIHVKVPFNILEPRKVSQLEKAGGFTSEILDIDNGWLTALESLIRSFDMNNLVFITDDYAISIESYAVLRDRIQDVVNTTLEFHLPRGGSPKELIRFISQEIDKSSQQTKTVVLLVNNPNLANFFTSPTSSFSNKKVRWVIMSPFIGHKEILKIEGVPNVDVITNNIKSSEMTSHGYLKREEEINEHNSEGFQSVQLIQLMAVIEKLAVNQTFKQRIKVAQNISCFETIQSEQIENTQNQSRVLADLRSHLEEVTPPLELFRGQKVYNGFIQTLNWKRMGQFQIRSINNSSGNWSFDASDLEGDGDENSLNGKVIRVVTVEEEPFIIRRENPDSGEVTFEGYCIEVLHAVQQKLAQDGQPFDYVIYSVQDGQYGVYLQSEQRWTGLVGDILMEKADIAVAGMIRNYDREMVVDFVASHMDYGVGILIRKPKHSNNIMGFMEPLAARVWICICLAGFVTALGMYLLTRFSPLKRRSNSKEEGTSLTFANSIWFVISSFLQQGCDTHPPTMGSRILISFWYFFALIIVATYTANLAAFLTGTD